MYQSYGNVCISLFSIDEITTYFLVFSNAVFLKLEYSQSSLGDPSCLQLKFTKEALRALTKIHGANQSKAPALTVQFSAQNSGLLTIGYGVYDITSLLLMATMIVRALDW